MRTVSSFLKGLKILEFIAATEGGVRVSEIARHFEMPSSNLTLFVNTLLEGGYILKDPVDGQYYLSERIHKMAEQVKPNKYSQVQFAAQEEMDLLHKKFDENVLLGVLSHYALKFIARRQSTRPIQIVQEQQQTFLPHVTSAGKAIMAFLPDAKLQQYFNSAQFPQYTEKTHTNRQAVLDELHRVRQQRYAINRGEFEREIMAVAAPVFQGEDVIASLVVQFPSFRYQEKELHNFAVDLVESADRVSHKMKRLSDEADKYRNAVGA